MAAKIYTFIFFSICLLPGFTSLVAQTYLKSLTDSGQNFNQRIARFENGDILIGDSSTEALKSGSEEGIIQLSRLDNCGTVVWSYQYKIEEGYVEFKDFQVNGEEEVFIYGSFYKGLSERIFLLKVDGKTGSNQAYHLWNTGTVDHFSYSIDLKAGQLMIYGLRLGFQTQKQGFIGVFNEDLVFQWGKTYAPFESAGEAIFTAEGGFIAWSGNNIIKMGATGELEGSYLLNTLVVSGPLEVTDGFIFEANSTGQSFLFKLDRQGRIIWQTDLFEATDDGAALTLLRNDNLLCTYVRKVNETKNLYQLEVAPNGQIYEQRVLRMEQKINPGTIYQTIFGNQISIATNSDPVRIASTDFDDFILQYSLDELNDECFSWENIEVPADNKFQLEIADFEMQVGDFELELESRIESDPTDYNLALVENCDSSPIIDTLERDTLLTCGTDFWEVELPGTDFYWLDGNREFPRQLNIPGTYIARNRNCINPIELSFELSKESCGCKVYLPNAFSPNGDGINDQLEYFANCVLEKVDLTLFNRWGEQVFYSRRLADYWDGTYGQQKVPDGVYIAILKYEWIDFDGNPQEDIQYQEIMVIN